MKTLRLFLLIMLLSNFLNLLIAMESDSQQTDYEDIEAADESDVKDTKTKGELEIKIASDTDEDSLEKKMANLNIKSTSYQEFPKKHLLELPNKAKELQENKKGIKAQIIKEKIEILKLQGINPVKIPMYLLKLLLNENSSVRYLDTSPSQTKQKKSLNLNGIKMLIDKIKALIASKANNEIKKLVITINKKSLTKFKDDNFKNPITICKEIIGQFEKDPNISQVIHTQDIITYIVPIECKAGWNTASKIITIISFAAALGVGIYNIITEFGFAPTSNNNTATILPSTPIETAGYYYY